MHRIGVFGAGSWGAALARMLYNSGHQVEVWSASEESVQKLNETHRQKNLPEVELPEGLIFTTDVEKTCRNKDIILIVVPSIYVRQTMRKAAPYITKDQIIVVASKGIEAGSLMTMSEIIEDELQKYMPAEMIRVVALSGPTHAEEVAIELPSTIVAACKDEETAKIVQKVFSCEYMRVYTNSDIKGVELCGALKNVMALASGISQGLGYGDNARAALITRSLVEMERLGEKMGCEHDTFQGLAGVGDLIVTCTSRHSRNNRCGFYIGQGLSAKEAVEQVGMVVEGLNTLKAATTLAEKYEVEMPIVSAVDQIVNQGISAGEAVRNLMNRDQKSELPKQRFTKS